MKQKKDFLMMRHGETVANREGYAAGSLDTPLTEIGKRQAEKAERIVFGLDQKIDYIVHSQLSRSKDTAFIVNRRLKLPTFEMSRLAEQSFGDWQGMQWNEMRVLLTEGQKPPNGESLDFFYDRAIRGIEESIELSGGFPLIVSHGGIFDAFLNFIGVDEIDVKNCGLYMFSCNEEGGSTTWNIREVH